MHCLTLQFGSTQGQNLLLITLKPTLQKRQESMLEWVTGQDYKIKGLWDLNFCVCFSWRPFYLLQKLCGLPINTYFSAVKLKWLIDNCEAVQKAIAEDRCCFGTVDSWLIWVRINTVNNLNCVDNFLLSSRFFQT